MIDFWLSTVALSLIAVLFVVVPVFQLHLKSKLVDQTESDQDLEFRQAQNVAIFKDRASEIEFDRLEGNIDDTTYEQLISELEDGLLKDTELLGAAASAENANEVVRPRFYLALAGASAFLMIAMSYWTYSETGAYEQVEQAQSGHFDAGEISKAKQSAEAGDINALLTQLHNKLKEAPNNIEGWTLLARSSMKTESFDLAVESYTQIIRLLEESGRPNSAVYGLLAQALYYRNNGNFDEPIQNAVDQAFSRDKNELNSLGLLAIHSYSSGDFQEAIDLWQRILNISVDHPSRASIEAGIERARVNLGLKAVPDDGLNSGSKADDGHLKAQITVNLSISPELTKLVDDNDTIFVFAKAAQGAGPNIPLAASRHIVSELPLTIVLNDAKSMGPMANLSLVQTASVVARISKSGNPIAQADDFEASQHKVSVFTNAIIDLQIIGLAEGSVK